MTQRIKLQVGGRSWTPIRPMPASRLISGITDPHALSLAANSAKQKQFGRANRDGLGSGQEGWHVGGREEVCRTSWQIQDA